MTAPIGLNLSQVFAKNFGISGNRWEISGKVYHKRKPNYWKPNYYKDNYAACDSQYTHIVVSRKEIPYVKKQAAARFRIYSPCKKCFKQELGLTTTRKTATPANNFAVTWATGWDAGVVNNFLTRKLGTIGFKCVSSYTGQFALGQIYTRKAYNKQPYPCSSQAVHIAHHPEMARSFALGDKTLYLAIMRPSYANTQVYTSGYKDNLMDYKYYGQAYEIIGRLSSGLRVSRKQIFAALKIKDVYVQ